MSASMTMTARPAVGRRFSVPAAVLPLTVVAAVAAAFSAAVGLWSHGGPGRSAFRTVHGEVATLYGEGLYRNDTVLIAVGNRGTDAVTLLLLVPALLVALVGYRRGSRTASLVVVGVLGWLLYYSASLALGAALNPLLPVYTLVLACTALALSLALRSLRADAAQWRPRPGDGALIAYLLTLTAALCLAWLPGVLTVAVTDTAPRDLGPYTTHVTWVLDLGLVVPAAVVVAVLLRRGSPTGRPMALAILALNVALGLALIGQGAAQLLSDVPLTAAEIVTKMASFAVLTVIAAALLVRQVGSSRTERA